MRLTLGMSFIIFVLICHQISGRSLDSDENHITKEKPPNRPLGLWDTDMSYSKHSPERLHGDQDGSTKNGYRKKNSMSQVSKLHVASTIDNKITTHSPLKSKFMRFGKR